MTTFISTPAQRVGRPGFTASDVTRSMLGYLVLAGPCYVAVSLVQALTRDGFNLGRDEWSLLALGHWGWIQMCNLVLTGAMTVVGAVGLRRGLGATAPATAGRTWAPQLLAGYGVALVGAGLFRADAADGFPPGRALHVSWHGALHIVFRSLGFLCLIATCYVLARHYRRRARRAAALAARVVGTVFAIAFAGIASGANNVAVNIGFTAAVIISYAWLATVGVDVYRRTRVVGACATSGRIARDGLPR